jgi:RNA polymerase sigma-70 factor (ECF subfamily)
MTGLSDMADLDIVQKCIQGDRRSQQALFDDYRKRVYSLAWRMLGPRFEIDDVVQEIFVSLFESLPAFKGLSSLDTWVYRVGVKVCTDQLRRKYRKRQVPLIADGGEAEERTGVIDAGFEERLEQRELRDGIFEALGRLTLEKRQVVVLFEMEGKSLEEVAQIVQTPVGTVKSRLFHGRNELKKHLRRRLES